MTNDDRMAILWDERLIRQLIFRFGRCLDVGDWPGWRSCFTDQVTVDFKRLTGREPFRLDASLWAAMIERALSPLRRHHVYTNFAITLNGHRAHAVVYMTARHWASTDLGVSHNTQYGCYDFHLERVGDAWLIGGYKHDFQWIDGNAGILDVQDASLQELAGSVFTKKHFDAAKTGCDPQGRELGR